MLQCILRSFQCCSSKQLVLNTLGLSLAVSGVFRFWIPLEQILMLLHVNPIVSIPQVLLLFNWTNCILLESYSVVIFQVPWSHIKLENMSKLRVITIIVMTLMGLACVCSMWQMCVDVGNCVLESGYCLMNVPLLLAMISAMVHSIVLGLCVPVQAIIIPMECNKAIPTVNYKKSGVTLLTAHVWLLIHFMYLCVYYSSYHSMVHVLAILYRSCCTGWMIIYCCPGLTLSSYRWLKRHLPDWFRPFLRVIVRDNYLSIKIWRNIKRVITLRTNESTHNIDGSNFQGALIGLFTIWMEIIRYIVIDIIMDRSVLLPCIISLALTFILLGEYSVAGVVGVLIVGMCYAVRHASKQDCHMSGESEHWSFYKKYHNNESTLYDHDDSDRYGKTIQKLILRLVYTMAIVFVVLQQSQESILLGGMVTMMTYCILCCYEVYRRGKLFLTSYPDQRMCSEHDEDCEIPKFTSVYGLVFCCHCYEIHYISKDELSPCIKPQETELFVTG